MRVLPIGNAAETTDNGSAVSATVTGVDAQVFQNGSARVRRDRRAAPGALRETATAPRRPGQRSVHRGTQQITVVDTSQRRRRRARHGDAPAAAVLLLLRRGWGWGGFWYYDWYDGANVVQVGNDALAFRRWYPQYAYDPQTGYPVYADDLDALYVIDLKNPDAPTVASMTITDDATAWWGNMKAIGNTLYTTHYEWVSEPVPGAPGNTVSWTRYYLDQVDLSDRAHPRIGQSINVPGTLVGASSEDPTVLYFADYDWDGENENDGIAACKVDGGKCYLQSYTQLDGYVGNVIVQNDKAFMTVQEYDWMLAGRERHGRAAARRTSSSTSSISRTRRRRWTASRPTRTTGGAGSSRVQGDRAVVTSGWGPVAVDIYKLSDTAAPAFDQTVRTLGWGSNAITRQGNTLLPVERLLGSAAHRPPVDGSGRTAPTRSVRRARALDPRW